MGTIDRAGIPDRAREMTMALLEATPSTTLEEARRLAPAIMQTHGSPAKPDLRFISHRIPYPPDKGEKIRGLNLLKHLARTYRIHLGCLMDSPEDPAHLVTLREWCVEASKLSHRQAPPEIRRPRPPPPRPPPDALLLPSHRPCMPYVEQKLAATRFDVVYGYSVAMDALRADHRISPAWFWMPTTLAWFSMRRTSTARNGPPTPKPPSSPCAMSGPAKAAPSLAYERRSAMACDATLFVSPQESARFQQLAPESADRVHAVENGVDLARFSPTLAFDTPVRFTPVQHHGPPPRLHRQHGLLAECRRGHLVRHGDHASPPHRPARYLLPHRRRQPRPRCHPPRRAQTSR